MWKYVSTHFKFPAGLLFYLEVDEELDEGGAGAVEHALCRTAALQAALARRPGLDLGPGRRGAGHDALDRAAHLPHAVGVPGAEILRI